jgi:uncharacterized membrane protein
VPLLIEDKSIEMLVRMLIFLLLFSFQACCGRLDPDTGRTRILYIGDGWGPSPVPKFISDPAFTIVSVPTSELHVGHGVTNFDNMAMRKFVRLYMPRNYEEMIGNHDLVVLSDANRLFMEGSHIDWILDSTTKEGFGLIMIGGLESFGGPRGEPWTDLEPILPVNFIPGDMHPRSFKVKPAIDHPFTRSLPWESIPYFHSANKVSLKQEAILLLTADETKYPPLSFADYGEGRGVAHSSDWTPGAGQDVMRWEYYIDYVANIAYLATQNHIPQDATLIHLLRTSFWSSRSRQTSVMDTLNFVEKFGARTQGIEIELEKVREAVSEAEELYIRQDYESSRSRIDDIDEMILELQNEAMKLKDSALFWVYVIEWTVMTGTALVAGFVLWSLMVQRRLYREVRITRMRTLDQ